MESNSVQRNRVDNLLIAMVLVTTLCGCAPAPSAHEDLDATLWMQTSAEYQAACFQAFQSAEQQMSKALHDRGWSADLIQQEQLIRFQPDTAPLLPAVILDIDETVLDNSPYQARLIQRNASFELDSWNQWVEESRADPVPGVKAFVQKARDAGVIVFFVTNRESSLENATRRNLEALGLSQPDEPDRILSKHERDEWTSDKATRRAHIATRYRILLIVGDDLNDFVSVGNKPTAQERRRLAADHRDMWGTKWIQLPNADYGGWERSLYDWDDAASQGSKLEKKLKTLDLGKDPIAVEVVPAEAP